MKPYIVQKKREKTGFVEFKPHFHTLIYENGMNKGIGRLRERGHYRQGFGEENFYFLAFGNSL